MKMFKATTLALAFTVAGALQAACPDLTGSYSCPHHGTTYELVFSQSEADGVTTYNMDYGRGEREIIADGMDRMVGSYTFNASCGEGTLDIHAANDARDVRKSFSVTEDGPLMIHVEYTKLSTGETKVKDYSCQRL